MNTNEYIFLQEVRFYKITKLAECGQFLINSSDNEANVCDFAPQQFCFSYQQTLSNIKKSEKITLTLS